MRRRDTSTERDLFKVREAHQRALADAATLEQRIERLGHSIIRGQQDARAHSQSCDHQRRRSQGEQEVPQGLTRGQPHPFPSLVGPRDPGR